ncbi:hypothetical protein HCQ94_00415 [Actinomyces sp. zg-332]|uniref:hypothetical protein n=1 Tax=Actinomyces sp. zg-332 TaxID=2708340 RepID=UPI00142354AD|nr:hypothetical protein [Actinomyces sp. zg-332]QPK94218.1 hypothetical protein HCQ94_00415 [Actinomyces sp. zg-332]
MKTQFILFTIFNTAIRYVLGIVLDKAWVKGAKRDVPKDNGINNSLGEYLFYVIITTIISAVISRQVGIWANDYMQKNGYLEKDENIDNILEF